MHVFEQKDQKYMKAYTWKYMITVITMYFRYLIIYSLTKCYWVLTMDQALWGGMVPVSHQVTYGKGRNKHQEQCYV